MNNTFQLQKTTTATTSVSNPTLDGNQKTSFKESLTGIEKYWNELNTEDKKNKDIGELSRMYKEYQTDEFNDSMEIITQEAEKIKYKLKEMIQRIMWDVRTRILFSEF